MIVATRSAHPEPFLPAVARHSTGADPARLPLYLYGRQPTSVDIDGPALKVDVVARASRRFPLARIARIICGHRVEWRAAALACCQQQRLPIVFVGADQQVTGYLQPVLAVRSRLDRLIEEFIDRPDWPEHYRNWQRAERMDLLLAWRAGRHQAGFHVDESGFDERVRRHVYHPDDPGHRPVIPGLPAGMILAYVLQILDRAGLQARYWGDGGKPLPLADDLDKFLQLAMYLEIGACGLDFSNDAATVQRLAGAFGSKLQATMRRLLGRLHRRLRATLEQWH